MEKQLLYLLDYDLRFDEKEVCRLFAPFLPHDSSPLSASAFVCLPLPAPKKDPVDPATAAATRASALNKVAQARKVRTEAQQQSQLSENVGSGSGLPPPSRGITSDDKRIPERPSYPPKAHVHVTASSIQTSSSSGLTSAMRGIAKRLSTAHLRQSTAVSGNGMVYASLSTESSSSSSTDLLSLVDDTGSTSSSSGWMSSGSDTDDSGLHNQNRSRHDVGIVDPSTGLGDSLSFDAEATVHLAGPGTMKKPFSLRPSLPSFRGSVQSSAVSGNDVTPTRSHVRKPSDSCSESVHTITLSSSSPTASVATLRKAHAPRGGVGVSSSLAKKPSTLFIGKDLRPVSSSSTVPCMQPTANSAFFPHAGYSGGGPGGSRLRPGTMVHRPSSVMNAGKSSHLSVPKVRMNVAQPPSLLVGRNSSSSSSSSFSANSSSSLMGSGNTPAFSSGSSSGSNSTRVVGSIFSRMWGAAAANLKGGGGQCQSHLSEERRHLREEEGFSTLEV